MLLLLFFFSFLANPQGGAAEEKWPGVDKAVVEKVATEHGRTPGKRLIDTDKGDLLLFLFLLAGVVGGFAAGYYWRALTGKERGRE